MQGVTVVDHPLVQHKLTLIREKDLLDQIVPRAVPRARHPALLRGHPRPAARLVEIETPMTTHEGAEDRRQEAGVRADPARRPRPCRRHARSGAGGARRPYRALSRSRHQVAVEYYLKTPADLAERMAIVVSPVVATANTAVAAIDRLKERGARGIRLVCLIAAPEGSSGCAAFIPTCRSGPAAIDEHLDERRLHRSGPGRRRQPRLRHGIAGARYFLPSSKQSQLAA